MIKKIEYMFDYNEDILKDGESVWIQNAPGRNRRNIRNGSM